MINSKPKKSFLVPLKYEFVVNKTDSHEQIFRHVKTLYPDISDEFVDRIASKYIRNKLKSDPIGLIKTMKIVESNIFDKSDVNNVNISTKSLNYDNGNFISNNVETATEGTIPKPLPKSDRGNLLEIYRSENSMLLTNESKNTNTNLQRNEISIPPGELSYEDFRNLTNIEVGIKDDILKKFPNDSAKYLARIEKFIRKYYENNFVYESQWPDKVKFLDSSIRTIDDLNRAKERLLAKESMQTEVAEINPSPDLFPSSGESRDDHGSSQKGTSNSANAAKNVEFRSLESDSPKGSTSTTSRNISNKDNGVPLETSESHSEMEILGPSLPEVQQDEILLSNHSPETIFQNQSSCANYRLDECSQISCHGQITILPRELSYDDFRNFTNIESYVRNNIKKKFPSFPSSENYLVPIEMYIKNLIEGDLIHCNEWPDIIKFNDPTIRTLEDLNRLKEQLHDEMADENMNSELELHSVDGDMFTPKEEEDETIQFFPTVNGKVNPDDNEINDLVQQIQQSDECKQYGEIEKDVPMDEDVIGQSQSGYITNSKSQNHKDLTFCDIADFSNNVLSQGILSGAADPLELKEECMNLMNVSSSGSSMLSSDTVLFKVRGTTNPLLEEVIENELQVENMEHSEVSFTVRNSNQPSIVHEPLNDDISVDRKSFFSESINASLQKSNETLLEIVTNEELNVLRDLCRKLNATDNTKNDDSIDPEDEKIENSTDMNSLKSYIKRLSEIVLKSTFAEECIENPLVSSSLLVENIESAREVEDDKSGMNIKQEEKLNKENGCDEIMENQCSDTTSDLIYIENDPTLPIVIEDTDNVTENLVAKMMDISAGLESGQNSFCDNAFTKLQNEKSNQLDSQSACEGRVEMMDICPNTAIVDHELSNKPELTSLACNVNSSQSAKRRIIGSNVHKIFKKPRKQSDILNKHPPKKINKKNVNKPKKNRVHIKNKVIDGIEVPIVPQITHNFRPLQLFSLSKREKIDINLNESKLLGTSKPWRKWQKSKDSKIIEDASATELELPHNAKSNVSNALPEHETNLYRVNVIEMNDENLDVLLTTDLSNDSNSCIYEAEKQVNTMPLYQLLSDYQLNWITLLNLRSILNKGHFRISYDNDVPLLGSHAHVSVESKVLVRRNEFLCIDILGNKMKLRFKWNKIADDLITMFSALVFTSRSNNYMTGELIPLRAFEQILDQFRKYLKFSIRVEQRHREFILSSSIDTTSVILSSKLFIRKVIKAMELCKAFADPA